MRYDGMMDRQRSAINSSAKAIEAHYDNITHSDGRRIVEITNAEGETLYVVSGNIETTADGRVDTERSYGTVLAYDPTTGKRIYTPTAEISSILIYEAQPAKEQAVREERQRMMDQFQQNIATARQAWEQAEQAEQQATEQTQEQQEAEPQPEQTEAQEQEPSEVVNPQETTTGQPQPQQVETEQQPATETTATATQLPSPAEQVANLYSDPELTAEEADGIIQLNIDEAQKALDRILSKPPGLRANSEQYKEAKRQWQQKINDARQTLDYWKAVQDEATRAKQATAQQTEPSPTSDQTEAPQAQTDEQTAEQTTEATQQPVSETTQPTTETATETPVIEPTAEETQETTEAEPQPIGRGVFGDIYDQFRGKVKEAFAFLMRKQSGDVLGVFNRERIGAIDLVWGDVNGGLQHIISKHVGTGKSFASIEEAQNEISDIIANGKVIFENGDKVVISKDNKIVTLRKNYREKGKKIADKNWILTAYDETKADGTSAISGTNQGQAAQPTNVSPDKDSNTSAENQPSEGKIDVTAPISADIINGIEDTETLNGLLAEIDKQLSDFSERHAIRAEEFAVEEQYGSLGNAPAEVQERITARWQAYHANTRILYDNKYAIQDRIRAIERAQAEAEKQDAIAQEQARQATVYNGFLVGMSPMARGRAEKTLSKRQSYNGNVMTRAEFIEQCVSQGREFSIGEWNGKSEYRVSADKGFYTITKLEYDYAQYLKQLALNNATSPTTQTSEEKTDAETPASDQLFADFEALHNAFSQALDNFTKYESDNPDEVDKLGAILNEKQTAFFNFLRRLSDEELLAIKRHLGRRKSIHLNDEINKREQAKAKREADEATYEEIKSQQPPIARTKSRTNGKLEDATGNDPLRPHLSGIYHDPEGYAVASDTHILVAEKQRYDKLLKGNTVGKDGTYIKQPFPKWRKIFPTSTTPLPLNLPDLLGFIGGVEKIRTKKSERDTTVILLRDTDGIVRYYRMPHLKTFVNAAIRLGATDADLRIEPKDGKLMVKTPQGLALLAPHYGLSYAHTGYVYEPQSELQPTAETPAEPQPSVTEAPQYSLVDVVRTIYEKGKTYASKLFSMKFFDVAQTPDFMKQLGLRGDKFTIRYGVIARHTDKDGSHNLSEKVWANLPQALQTPFAITKLTNENDAYRIYTTLKNDNGEYIVVGVDVKNAGRNLEVNAISTAFGRRNEANLPANEEVIYRSKEITPDQSSLLNRPNSDQYPTNQESSADEVTQTSADTQDKIQDFGEVIAGARKDLAKVLSTTFENATIQSLIELPFSKAFKMPDLAKLVKQGVITEEEALTAKAIQLALMSSPKPKLPKSRYKMARAQSELAEWATQRYKAIQLLEQYLKGTTKEREIILSAEIEQKETIDATRNARVKELERLNPGKTFETGNCYSPNPIVVVVNLLKALDYKAGDKIELKITTIKSNELGTQYRLYGPQNNMYIGTPYLTYEEAFAAMLWHAKFMRGDADATAPLSYFRFAPTRAITTPSGTYIVNYYKTPTSTSPRQERFTSKEEAEAFASKYARSIVTEATSTTGYTDYVITFRDSTTAYEYTDGKTYATRSEAEEALKEHYEEINEELNRNHSEAIGAKGQSQSYYYVMKTSYRENPYLVVERRSSKVIKRFPTEAEAQAHAEKIETARKQHIEAMRKFVYFSAESSPRRGTDYRKGADVTPEQFTAMFGFRGVQFGNWTNASDRQEALNQAYDAFLDLADVIGVSPRALSLNGELGIAFGSRGGGSALAHYEPDEVVINLTKTRGAGSLAHEWWHALDNYFSRQGGTTLGMATKGNGPNIRDEVKVAFKKIVSTIKEATMIYVPSNVAVNIGEA